MKEYDFTRVNINRSADIDKISFDVIMKHFTFLIKTLQWIQRNGEKFIEQDNISYEDWQTFLKKVFCLHRDCPRSCSVQAFFITVIEKGIDALNLFATSSDDESKITEWFKLIKCQLQPSAWPPFIQLGVESDRYFDIQMRRRFVMDLVPVAQRLKSEYFLESLAKSYCDHCFYLFVKNYKNW